MSHIKTGVLLLLLLTSLFSVGCAPVKPYRLADYKRDPQFNMLEVLATGVVLGGVTVTGFPVSQEERKAFTAQLEDVLIHFSMYRVNTPIKLSEQVSPESYEQMLNYFKTHNALPDSDIKQLKGMYTPARYLLFVNIDGEDIKQYTVNNPDAVEYRSVRMMAARLYIFNMDTSAVTLYTRISVKNAKKNSVQKIQVGSGFGMLLGNVVAQVALGGYPEPPTREETLYKLFLGVAEQIPSN